jgi:hypothetical protein
MIRIFALLIAALVSASMAHAGNAKIEAVITTGLNADPLTTVPSNAPKVFALYKTNGVQEGDKLRGVWIADDVGNASKGTKMDEKTVTAEGDTEDGMFSLNKPWRGWSVGKYHIDIYVNSDLATTVKFTIKAPGSKKDSKDDSDEHAADD